MVERHWSGPVCDIGIGCGSFLTARQLRLDTGFDVSPVGIKWLRERGRWQDIYSSPVPAVTMWDSFEHIEDPCVLLRQVRRWVFMAIPLFRDAEHVLGSKHYRRDEHYWYFTYDGLVGVMREEGFVLREHNRAESEIGREDICSFAFERVY